MRRLLWMVIALAAAAVLAGCHGHPHTFTVTTAADGPDAAPGDGVCEMTPGVGDCSVRAAIDEANVTPGTVDVVVPEGTYPLAVGGVDDTNAGGDLDVAVSGTLNLRGPGAGARIDAAGLDGVLDVHTGKVVVTELGLTGASGAGLTVQDGASASVARSSSFGNGGPGIAVAAGGQVNALHTTISGNGSAASAGGVVADGALIGDYLTVADNTGGGIGGAGSVALGQSVVGRQATGSGCAQPVASAGHNTVVDSTCGLGADGQQVSYAGLLLDLTSDLVPHHPLAAGSRAMDSIPLDSGVCGTALKHVDQRLLPRPAGAACDAGAVEAQGGLSLVVDSAFDVLDANPGDGVCDVGDGTCTLRAAITETNLRVGPDSVLLAVSPTLARPGDGENDNLSGDIDILDSLALDGGGQTVDGGGIDRVLHQRSGHLEIEDLVITGGWRPTSGTDRSGTGLHAGGWSGAVLTGVEIHGNTSHSAVYSVGSLDVVDSEIRDNDQAWAIDTNRAAEVAVEGTTIDGNGGGISSAGSLEVRRSSIVDNDGPGISGSNRSTIPAPYAVELVVTSSTISGNRSPEGAGLRLDGLLWIDRVEITASTLTDNGEAGGGVGGISGAGGPTVDVRGTIAARNIGGDCDAPVTSGGGNLDGDGSCGFGAGDLPSGDPLLAPLADNGGPTPTHLPFAISPVVDAIAPGTPGLCDGTLPVDQRGFGRPDGAGCDVGAVEGRDVSAAPFVLVVDTAVDGPDTSPGDGACTTAAGGCSLRAAVDEANALPHPSNRIEIDDGVDPVLSIPGVGDDANATGDLDVLAPVTISGASAVVDGGQLDRVLDVASPGVVVEDVVVTGGRLADTVGRGGGVQVRAGDLLLRRSTLSANRVTGTSGRGGGLAALAGTDVRIEQSTLSGNVVGGFGAQGGGLHVDGATATVVVSTISGNQAFAGAGIHVGAPGDVLVVGVTLAGGQGATTLSGSSAELGVRASVIGPGTTAACSSSLGTGGSVNASFDASCGFSAPWSGFDPQLLPLGDNGGPTATHLLPPGSPLRDLVPTGAWCEAASTVDQRGLARPVGTGCDLGAVEGP